MDITLSKKPKSPTIIVGFPGIGLVGPIVTEFLIEHMKTEQIGEFTYDELPPTVAIHKGKLIHPMSVHYSREHNTLILYTILNLRGNEWRLAEIIEKLAKDLNAKEVLCIDGANTLNEEDTKLYAFGNNKLMDIGASHLEESVITGVGGALLLSEANASCIFAGTQMDMPNSKAAAEVVKFLDKYLNLEVDPEPLMKQAEQFEKKLKTLLDQSKNLMENKDKHTMDYLG